MKRCLLVAPVVSHATAGRIAALGSGSYELHVADISARAVRHRLDRHPFSLVRSYHDVAVGATDPVYRSPASYATLVQDTLRSRRLLPEDAAISRRLREIVAAVKPSVAVVYHSYPAIHFGRLLRRLFPGLPIVIIHNTIPVTLERRDRLQRCLRRGFIPEFVDYNEWLAKLDFSVCASEGMAEFAQRRFGMPRDRTFVLPDYFPRSAHARPMVSPHASNGAPRLIFVGAPERWGTTIDNVDAELLSIAKSGITVHSGEMSQAVVDTGHGVKYPYFTDDEVFEGRLANYASACDAALIAYGVKERRERFRTTLPTRFFTALTAGIPLAVKGGMFDAVEDYVRRNGNGFVYHDTAELKEKLMHREDLSSYRRNAIAHLDAIGGEKQAADFVRIFEGIST